MRSPLLVVLAVALLGGCATNPREAAHRPMPTNGDSTYVSGARASEVSDRDRARGITAEDKQAAMEQAIAQERHLRDAYNRGVRDTLEDFKGRMRAQSGFVWEPPMVEYVEMPAQRRGGAVYPSRVEPVIIRPGRWVEANDVMLPDYEQQ